MTKLPNYQCNFLRHHLVPSPIAPDTSSARSLSLCPFLSQLFATVKVGFSARASQSQLRPTVRRLLRSVSDQVLCTLSSSCARLRFSIRRLLVRWCHTLRKGRSVSCRRCDEVSLLSNGGCECVIEREKKLRHMYVKF